MNTSIKLICLSILATAPAIAMDHRAGLGEPNARGQRLPKARAKRNYADEVWPRIDCLTPEELVQLKKARAKESEESLGEFLITAARDGNIEAVKELLWRGVSANYKSPQDSYTPLMYAAENGHSECAQTLIAAKADIHQMNNVGRTALDCALLNGHDDLEALIPALLAPKLTPEYTTPKPIDPALTPQLFAAVRENNFIRVKQLIHKGAQAFGNEALIEAVKLGHILCVLDLIAAHAQVDYADSQGNTPLMYAALNGYYLCAQALLDAKANIHLKNNLGKTALDYALINGHQNLEVLIKTYSNGMRESGTSVREPGVLVQPSLTPQLIEAAQEGDLARVKELLIAGAPAYGNEALLEAAKSNQILCVQELIAAKAQVDYTDSKNNTALLWAAAKGHASCVAALIAAGADLYHRNDKHRTPYNIASKNRHLEALELIKQALIKTEVDADASPSNASNTE